MADLVAGRYELGALVGAGGNGQVFAARDRVLDRPVAVKLVDAEAVRHRDPAGRERFLTEARTSAGFIHPNAVAVFDAGEADGSLFLVMELVEGETLAQRLQRGPLSPTDASRITADVLAALHAAHEAGIVHRDVKPANILLDRAGHAKLADFGIAKRLDSVAASLTNPGQFFGTPKYLAPEQIDGRGVSPATDVYAVGIVLYEMLTGRPPFDEGQPMATAIAQRDAPVPDVRQARPDAPAHLVSVVERSLRKEPAERFPTAAAMRDALVPPAPTVTAPTPPSAPVGEATVALREHVPAAPLVGEATVALDPRRDVPPTTTLPRPTSSVIHGDLRPRRWGRAIAIVLVLAALGVVAFLVTRDESSSTGEPPGSTAPGETPATTVVATETTAPAIVLPPDVPALIDYLAPDPSVAGARGGELLDRLREFEKAKNKKRADRAEDLVEKIDEWEAAGELDPGLADLARQLLARALDT